MLNSGKQISRFHANLVINKNIRHCIRYGINSFRYTASKLWNELPEHFRNETNFNQFFKLISTWTDNSCRCNADGQFLLIILNVSSAIDLSLRTFSDGNFDKCSSSS
jgi:hypothetical protein